jgi:flagellar hook-basal body complex protein FliE
MSITFSAATSAYGQAQKLISQSARTAPEQQPKAAVPDFGELVSQNIGSVIESGKASDQMSLDLINGKANIVDVVTAVAETEVAIESMVTIRDRVIQAYEEIMRMPI